MNRYSGSKRTSFCETSTKKLRSRLTKRVLQDTRKNWRSRLPNERFLRDFLENWIRTSKTSVFCETSSKTEAAKLQSEQILRDIHNSSARFSRDACKKRGSRSPRRAISTRLSKNQHEARNRTLLHTKSRFDPPKRSDLLSLPRKTMFRLQTCTDTW